MQSGKKFLVKGEWLTRTEAAKKYGKSIYAVRQRMYDKGMTLEEALFYDPDEHKKVNKGNAEWKNLSNKPRMSVEE